MNLPFQAERLALVAYDEAFLKCSWRWLNDPVIKHMTMTPDFTRDGQERWFQSLPAKTDYLIFGISLEGRRIGACGLKNITEADAEYWGYIGEPDFWGRGLGQQLVEQMMEVGSRHGLTGLWLKVAADNERAIRLYHRLGFARKDEVDGVLTMSIGLPPPGMKEE